MSTKVKVEEKKEEKEPIWQSILAEVAASKLNDPKHLILLGMIRITIIFNSDHKKELEENPYVMMKGMKSDRGTGKSSMINQLRIRKDGNTNKSSNPSTGELALSYSYIDALDDETEDTLGRLGVWQFEGNEKYGELLHFALNQKTIQDSLAVITLDFTKPWEFLDSLYKWLGILETAIDSLKLPKSTLEDLKEKNQLNYLRYREPQFNEEGKLIVSNVSEAQESLSVHPLPKGALTKNLGIPIIIVCLKSDAITMLEKEYNYKEADFDMIQQHLRKACLKYGAALCYSSVNQNKNTQVLLKYAISQLYNTNFKEKAQVVTKDTVFVPSGWDTLQKINLLNESAPLKEDDDEKALFAQQIRKPLTQKSTDFKKEIMAEDEQVFLQRHLDGASKPTSTPEIEEKPSAAPAAGKGATPKSVDKKKEAAPSSATPSPVKEPNTEVLQSFFQNLVKKAPQAKSN